MNVLPRRSTPTERTVEPCSSLHGTLEAERDYQSGTLADVLLTDGHHFLFKFEDI